MSRAFPLGQRESQRLEIKGADALKEPEKIAREVVAMLNAEGGEVWVGIREEKGTGVAVEPVAHPELEQRRLHDFLVDTIEPPLTDPEAKVAIERNEEGEAVLAVKLQPLERSKPYAFLRKGGRYFLTRIGDRIRPMTREEVLGQGSPGDQTQPAIARAFAARQKALAEREARLWLFVQPVADLDLAPQKYEELLYSPENSGNRSGFWSFGRSQRRAEWNQKWIRTNPEETFKVEITHHGRLTFSAPLGALCPQLLWPRDLWPQALVESIASALRLARTVYQGEKPSHEAPVVVDLVILGLRDHFLNPRIPDAWGRSRDWKYQEDDFFLVRPLVVPAGELLKHPDSVSWRLVERVYSDFGIHRDDMPDLFDERTGDLHF